MNENIQSPYYISKLVEELCKKQKINRSYSLRAFAKYLKMDSSNLSSILKGKRKLPSKRAQDIARQINLSPLEEGLFVRSAINHKLGLQQPILSHMDAKILNEEIHYNIISQWEYLVVLNLVKLHDQRITPELISDKLDISLARATDVLANLIHVSLLKEDENGRLVRTAKNIQTSEDKISSAIQKGHLNRLDLAKEKLPETDITLRDYSAIVITGNKKKLPIVKAMIREFQDNLAELLGEDEQDEIFQISMQVIPMIQKAGANEIN